MVKLWKAQSTKYMITIVLITLIVTTLTGLLVYTRYKTENFSPDRAASEQLQAPKPIPEAQEITTDGLFIAINEVRVKNGLAQFKRNQLLDNSSELKCADMVKDNYYEHNHPKTKRQGLEFIDEKSTPYEYASENLNAGMFLSPTDVVNSWMGSPSHAASILDPRFTEIGFAVCEVGIYPDETVVVQHKIDPL